MTWNSLRLNREVPVCCATGSINLDTANANITISPLDDRRIYACNTEMFDITENGAIRIMQPGTYAFTGGMYISPNTATVNSKGVDIAYTNTLGSTEPLTRFYAAMYQDTDGSAAGCALPTKSVRVNAPCDVYLRGWINGVDGKIYGGNVATFLNIVKLSN